MREVSQLIKLTNLGPGLVVLGEEFPGSAKSLSELRPGQTTVVRMGTTIRSETTNTRLKIEEINHEEVL